MKKGAAGIIIIVLIILIAGGASAYFVLFSDSRAVSGFTYETPNLNTNEICDYYDEYEGDICVKATESSVYYEGGGVNGRETDDVILFEITKGVSQHRGMLASYCDESANQCNRIRNVIIIYPSSADRPTFIWYYSATEFLRIKQWGSNPNFENSNVIQHYLDKYPPVQI